MCELSFYLQAVGILAIAHLIGLLILIGALIRIASNHDPFFNEDKKGESNEPS